MKKKKKEVDNKTIHLYVIYECNSFIISYFYLDHYIQSLASQSQFLIITNVCKFVFTSVNLSLRLIILLYRIHSTL